MREVNFRPETKIAGFPDTVWLINCGTMHKQKGEHEHTDPVTGETRMRPNPPLIKGIYLRDAGGEIMMFGSMGSAQEYIDDGRALSMWNARLAAIDREPKEERAKLKERIDQQRAAAGIPVVVPPPVVTAPASQPETPSEPAKAPAPKAATKTSAAKPAPAAAKRTRR